MYKILLACFCFGFFSEVNGSLKNYALEFPNKGVTDFVHLWNMRSLEQFTVCFWMQSSDASGGTPFSYAVPGADNELVISNYSNFTVWIGNEKRHLSLTANDGNWHHICVSWENRAGSLNFYKDGVLSASETNYKTGHKIRSGGSVMLGQDQAGGLNSTRSFQGFLSNLNVWDYVICQEIISRMSKACLSGEGNVYKWSYFKHGIEGDPRLFVPSPCAQQDYNINECKDCPENAACVNNDGSYTCQCPVGYHLNETNCTDIDECVSGVHDCHSSASCTNTEGSFNCSCDPLYTGDGKNCTPASECQNYHSFTAANRKITYTRGFSCDANLAAGWYRFEGDAGTRMPTSCPPIERCQTSAPSWLNGVHPTVADGIVTRHVCFPWTSSCCDWSTNIQVRNCGSFYVYYFSGTPNKQCYLRYCGTD